MYLTIKFGGETLDGGRRIRRAAEFLGDRKERGDQVTVVVSAVGDTTDRLLGFASELSGVDEEGNSTVEGFLERLMRRHSEFCNRAIGDEDVLSETVETLEEVLEELEDVLVKIEKEREMSPELKDLVLSFGERLSAPILSGTLRDLGFESCHLTGLEAGIVTDDRHLDARPIWAKTRDNIEERLTELVEQDVVPVVTGFIAGTEDGGVTTLGRGGSDYTASLIGSSLGVDEIWIMTDVDGIMTADPKIEPEARVIDRLSYLEATELAHFGAKVLNPKTIEPAMKHDIPVRVKNAFDLGGGGTLIVHDSERVEEVVKAITATMRVSIVTVGGPSMIGVSGVASKVLKVLEDENINVLMISQSSSQANISFIVKRDDLDRTIRILEEEFSGRHVDWKIDFDEKVSIVASVGSGMRGTPGVAARVFNTMGENDINILMIAQGSSELNISFAVSEKDAVRAVQRLHEEFELGD